MSIAKVSEVICSSPKSFEDAIAQGIARADKTLDNVKGAWIKDPKVEDKDGKIVEYRMVMKVTFVLRD